MIALIVLVLVAGGIWVASSKNTALAPTTETSPDALMEAKKSSASSQTAALEEGTSKNFELTGKPFEFSLKEMKVKKGETVKVTFTNVQGFHDWTLDGYNVKTKQLPAGQSETVIFVADKAGTFEYYCGVGNHRDQGMKGSLIVE